MKRRRLVLSALARADLAHIHLYLFEHNPTAADQFVLDFYGKMDAMADLGLSGVARDDIRPELRSLSYRERTVYFRTTDSRLHVIRILHGRRNLTADHFPESDDI